MLEVKDLWVSVDGVEILKGVSLTVENSEVMALMGPNGSGKTTLSYALMGHPSYKIEKGSIMLNGEDITGLSPDKRAKKGLFLTFQYPSEISGVTIANFLRVAYNSGKEKKASVMEFQKLLKEKMKMLNMDGQFASRYLNEGFSGGEKKKSEILQMAVLEPQIAILDEADSGTDVDALKTIAAGINTIKKETGLGILLITHYQRILNQVRPDKVIVMIDGKVAETGGPELAQQIEAKGYSKYRVEK